MERSTGRSTASWLSLFLIAVLVGQGWADCNYLTRQLQARFFVQEDVTVGYGLANFSAISLTISKANEQKYMNLLRVAESPPGWWSIEVNEPLDAEWETKPVDTCGPSEPIEKPTITFQCLDATDPDPGDYPVILIIEDVNEYAPVFSESDSTREINENETVGFLVYTVTAKDLDYEALTQFEYAIIDGSDGYFILPYPFSGQIFLNQSLDYDAGRRSFVLNISATEYPSSFGKTNYTTLTLIVCDVDDLPPKFSSPLYRVSIFEGDYTGDTWNKLTPVISAWDQDSQINEPIQFKIGLASKAQYSTLFSVNETNGLIGIDGHLSAGEYEILILAYQIDNPELRYDTALVIVTAIHVNRPPRMSEAQYQVSVSENASPQTILLVVSALDDDGGNNSVLIFQLGKTSSEIFTVETVHHTGIIRLNRSLDWDTEDKYIFEVWAEETFTPEKYRSQSSIVTITVLRTYTDKDNTTAIPTEVQNGTSGPTVVESATSRVPVSSPSPTGHAIRNDFDCHLTHMDVYVPVELAPNSVLRLKDSSCELQNNGTHYVTSFTYDQCNTTMQYYSPSLVLVKNEITVHVNLENEDIIQFSTDYTIPLTCVVRVNNSAVDGAFQAVERDPYSPQYGHSPNFEMKEFNSSLYKDEITQFPVKVPINREVFFELSLIKAPTNSSGIKVDKCEATPTAKADNPDRFLLISDGCPVSQAVKIQPRPALILFRFSVQTFHFSASVNQDNMVYVHCYLSLCQASDCDSTCPVPRRRRRRSFRRLVSETLTSKIHIITKH